MDVKCGYDNWAVSYDDCLNPTRDLDKTVTMNALENFHFHSILEIGCGTGKNTNFLTKIGDVVNCIDFSDAMMQIAKNKLADTKNVHFKIMDIQVGWEFEANTFDLALCNLVLEHIQDLDFVFAEAFRILKENGKFFICEYHPFRQYQQKGAVVGGSTGTVKIQTYTHHISEFVNAAKRNGFSLITFDEHWDKDDEPPRLVSFLFESNSK